MGNNLKAAQAGFFTMANGIQKFMNQFSKKMTILYNTKVLMYANVCL